MNLAGESNLGESDFRQEYEADDSKQQSVYMFCRHCRECFAVTIVGNSRARVRCKCGHKAPLSEFDVLANRERAKDFAVFYARVMSAVQDALAGAGIMLPPSPQNPPYKPGHVEDESDIRSAFVPSESSDDQSYDGQVRLLKAQVEAARGDVVGLHEALTRLIEYTYSQRILSLTARSDCRQACVEDIELVPSLIRESKRRRSEGRGLRLSFSCYKHLAILLEEEDEFSAALEISRQAKGLGLKGYDERITRLEGLIK